MSSADSAGVPWEGRRFERNASAADDGSAPAALMAAVDRFRGGNAGAADVVDAFRASRVLIPLVAELGEAGESATGHTIDKSQELSIVTVRGPDGRTVMPVFSSVDTMRAWNPIARPIPVQATRVALAALHESTEVVVLDATSPSEFAFRRPALVAIANDTRWMPPDTDERVLAEFLAAVANEPDVSTIALTAGDPDARLTGPEIIVRLAVRDGLDRPAIDALVERATQRWSASEIIAERVDSLRVLLTSAGD